MEILSRETEIRFSIVVLVIFAHDLLERDKYVLSLLESCNIDIIVTVPYLEYSMLN